MSDDIPKGIGERPRRRVTPIKVWVADSDKAEIADRAAQVGLSLSAGLNHPIRSVLDLWAVAELGKVNGDLGRVAGLLKLWLAEKRGEGASPVDVETLMREFRAQQAKLSAIMGQLVRGK